MCSSNVNKTFIINLFLDMMCQKKVKKDNIELPVLYIEIEFFADGNLDSILYNIQKDHFYEYYLKTCIISCVDQKKQQLCINIYTKRFSLLDVEKRSKLFYEKLLSHPSA